MMKLTLMLMTAAFLQVSIHGFSQKVQFNGTDVPLEKIFAAVEKQTGMYFVYEQNLLKNTRPVTVQASSMPLSEFLTLVLKNQSLQFNIENKTITIFRKQRKEGTTSSIRDVEQAVSTVKIKVMDEEGRPLSGASVTNKHTGRSGVTDAGGTLSFVVAEDNIVVVSYVGFISQSTPITRSMLSDGMLSVVLTPATAKLEEVEVTVNTGYQNLPKERVTGSFSFVDNKLLNRKVSTDIISRLEDIVPGLASFKTSYNNSNERGDLPNITIRGQSTLRSNKWPLIVIDGVPYENRIADYGYGNFNNINPNDVENITILKDAAAASIWGAKAGNGVIVITTKKGKFNQKLNLSINSNISIKNKPDLYAYPQMATSDYIDIIQELFNKGRYNGALTDKYSNVQPIVKLMADQRDNLITEEELNAGLDRLRAIDMRDDFMKYIYRKDINQQYSLRLSAGGHNVNTSIAIGYDKNLEEVITSNYNRFNIQSNTQFIPSKNLLFNFNLNYTESKKVDSYFPVGYNGLANGVSNYPYMQLADNNGTPLQLWYGNMSKGLLDTLGGGRLLDWGYVPLNELYKSGITQVNKEMRSTVSAEYKLGKGLKVTGLYSYISNFNPISDWRGVENYAIRDNINAYASWDSKQVYWNMPVGDQLLILNWKSKIQMGMFKMDYSKKWNDKHDLNLLAGYDIRELQKDLSVAQYYGYNAEDGTFQQMHAGKEVPFLNGIWGTSNLPDNNRFESLTDRFVSYYGNGAYTYRDRYILSASFRKDASNLFGVKSNDKGQPFWSVGGAWILSNEPFFSRVSFDYLKLRATYGYNGNINNSVSAYPIINIQTSANITTGQNYAQITTPPNPKLRWERVGNLNLGLDFSLKNNRVNGSIEFYHKTPKDLVAPTQVDPSVGFLSLTLNTANLDTKGWDVVLNARPILNKTWEWNSNLIFANSRTMVTKVYLVSDVASTLVSNAGQNPVQGTNLNSLYTYRWAGLDPADGTPRGYLNGKVSKDYIAIKSAKSSTLDNHGSKIPEFFGSFRNSIRYKDLELSWNISYQLGYKFIRESFNNAVFLQLGLGHTDYAKRWQKPGDELNTVVPAFTYPNNSAGSDIYIKSSALVENGGQIKLRDIQCSLQLPQLAKCGFKNLRVYGYVQNIATLWRANKKGIDPEYGNWVPDPLMTSIGINFNL